MLAAVLAAAAVAAAVARAGAPAPPGPGPDTGPARLCASARHLFSCPRLYRFRAAVGGHSLRASVSPLPAAHFLPGPALGEESALRKLQPSALAAQNFLPRFFKGTSDQHTTNKFRTLLKLTTWAVRHRQLVRISLHAAPRRALAAHAPSDSGGGCARTSAPGGGSQPRARFRFSPRRPTEPMSLAALVRMPVTSHHTPARLLACRRDGCAGRIRRAERGGAGGEGWGGEGKGPGGERPDKKAAPRNAGRAAGGLPPPCRPARPRGGSEEGAAVIHDQHLCSWSIAATVVCSACLNYRCRLFQKYPMDDNSKNVPEGINNVGRALPIENASWKTFHLPALN
ncbi:Protein of unknown function, partial [Gryllus bimaculatus]